MPSTSSHDVTDAPRSPRIMLVEDEFIIAMYMRRLLERFGAIVEGPLASGEEALERVSAFKPDLVLLDIKLAGEIDGVETGIRIRRTIPCRIVFTSAFSGEDILERTVQAAPDAFLVKPVEEGDIQQLFESLFGEARR